MSTINRSMTKAIVTRYTNGTDTYGQSNRVIAKQFYVDISINPYSHTNSEDPIYVDVVATALTKDISLCYGDNLVANGKSYLVKYIGGAGRYINLLLTEKSHS